MQLIKTIRSSFVWLCLFFGCRFSAILLLSAFIPTSNVNTYISHKMFQLGTGLAIFNQQREHFQMILHIYKSICNNNPKYFNDGLELNFSTQPSDTCAFHHHVYLTINLCQTPNSKPGNLHYQFWMLFAKSHGCNLFIRKNHEI